MKLLSLAGRTGAIVVLIGAAISGIGGRGARSDPEFETRAFVTATRLLETYGFDPTGVEPPPITYVPRIAYEEIPRYAVFGMYRPETDDILMVDEAILRLTAPDCWNVGVDKELYDRFQAYVRLLFDFSLAAIVVLAVLRMSGFRLWNSFGRFQFALAALLALCMIVLSLYSLWRMPSFREAYLQVNVEDVRIYYPDYEATTTVFSFGFVIFILNLLISGQFLAMLTARAIAGLKGADS